MVLPDIANIVAGAYKGYMNAAGQDVDPIYLAYVLGGSSLFTGVAKGIKTHKEGRWKSPAAEGTKYGLISIPLGALEIAVGYGLGYVAHKIVH